MELWWVVLLAGFIAIVFALWLARDVLSQDRGTTAMQEVAGLIFEGAMAFLNRQYRTIAIFAVLAAIIIGALIGVLANDVEHGVKTSIAFLVGAFCSGLAGFIGMYIAVQANLRTAAAAQIGVKEAINVSLRGGAVSGFLVVALSLLGVLGIFAAFGGFNIAPEGATAAQRAMDGVSQVPFEIVGFGFGASFVALFAQLGGGIYTKAADVGADLVGKVEAGIPEDDPRNAAVIADLVGDNVGDCAGRGADLFESTAAENIGAMILGVSLYVVTGNTAWVFFPLVVRSIGIFASMVGIMTVAVGDVSDPQRKLDQGYWAMTVIAAIGIVGTVWSCSTATTGSRWPASSDSLTSVAFVYITQYYTAGSWRPVQEIARASRTGPATNIIQGVAVGFESTGVTAIIISIALGLSFYFGSRAPELTPELAIGGVNPGLFGTAVATMGMLTTVAYILAMDTFGPITDNAGGIAQFSQAPENVRHITDVLDGIGNTTKALTKGYAVGFGGAGCLSALLGVHRRDPPGAYRGMRTGRRCRGVSTGRPGVPRRSVEGRGLHRRLPGPDADLLLQLAGDSRRRQGRRRDHRRSTAPVPRAPRHHAGHRATGLRARRGHHRPGRPARDDRAGLAGRPVPDRRGSGAARRSGRGPAHGRHHGRHPAGDGAQQLGWHLGQRQEVHRARPPQGRRRMACSARAPTPTPRPSSATPSAIPSRTPPARRCTC